MSGSVDRRLLLVRSLTFPSKIINYSTTRFSRLRGISRKYAAFIRQPDVGALLLASVFTRMPVGMVGFAMLMFLRDALGSFALAGSAVGINFVAMAATAPIIGRMVDRVGPKRVLAFTSVVSPLALIALLGTASAAAPFWLVATCAAIAGASATPITTLTRTVWRHMFHTEEDRRTAFSLDAVTIEINFALGPAIAALILSRFGTTASFAVAIFVVVAAVVVFLASPAMRYLPSGNPHAKRHLLGPLTDLRLVRVFLTTFGLTVCFGLLEVGYPAFGTALAAPALGGLLLSINSLGSATGGAIYGGLHFRMPVERQFAAAMGLMSLPLILHAWIDATIPFAIVAFFAGALIAPSIAAQSVLVSRLAPARYATEAFTWSSTFIVTGLGAGMAMGGWMVETVGIKVAFATGAAIAAAMALLAFTIPPAAATAPAAAD
jgi:MFS family permease